MRFIQPSAVSRQPSGKSARRLLKAGGCWLIQWPSRPVLPFLALKRLLGNLRRFFSGCEDAFFVAANTLVRVQPFKNKFCGGDLRFWRILRADVHACKFVHQTLDIS